MKAGQSKERTTTASTADEAQIQAVIDDWGEGLRNKDADRCVSHYADDIVQFDLAPPLETHGKATAKRNLSEWFKTFSGPIGFQVTGLKIWAGPETAFVHCMNHISGSNTKGEKNDHWVRVTIGFRKTEGKWLVNHEHVSVPFYMDGSFKAALDLKP